MARYDPFKEMDWLFEQLRTRVRTPDGFDRTGFGTPARGGINMDLKKHGEEYVFVADLPGFETEEIDLRFEDDALVLAAESTMDEGMVGDDAMDEARTDEIAVRREFTRSRRVSERVTIPETVAEDEISATYRNGVLEVHLPLVGRDADEDDARKINVAD
jgi:HSP20 family protein